MCCAHYDQLHGSIVKQHLTCCWVPCSHTSIHCVYQEHCLQQMVHCRGRNLVLGWSRWTSTLSRAIMLSCSTAVIWSLSGSIWGQHPKPMNPALVFDLQRSLSPSRAWPVVGNTFPARMDRRVLLPAPFSPRSATCCPDAIDRLKSSNATCNYVFWAGFWTILIIQSNSLFFKLLSLGMWLAWVGTVSQNIAVAYSILLEQLIRDAIASRLQAWFCRFMLPSCTSTDVKNHSWLVPFILWSSRGILIA